MKRLILITLATLCLSSGLRADEGMWMVNALDRVLEMKMQQAGCKLPANVIYDEENGGLCDAVVSLAFGCTGSVISDEGMVITNHHCAYSDLFKLSDAQHNYLEDGFWALRREDEIPVQGGGMYFLRKVIDVSEEADSLGRSSSSYGKPMGGRKLSYEMEKRYKEKFPGMDVSLYSMWAGEKHYIMVYEVYNDVRLVAAPPVCVGSFGGDIDNWEWPQHKGDFALYRIYAAPDGSPSGYSPDNVPLKPRKVLRINPNGIKEGDFTMTMGYPGATNRYVSSFELSNIVNQTEPVSAKFMKERMEILNKWFATDPSLRLKYSDQYFMLSNVQEIKESQVSCIKKYGVLDAIRKGQESKLPKELLDSLRKTFAKSAWYEKQIRTYQESGPRSGMLFRIAMRADKRPDSTFFKQEAAKLDMRVEKEIFILNISNIRKYMDKSFWGEYLTDVFKKYSDGRKAGEYLWEHSVIGTNPAALQTDDPVVRAICSPTMALFNKARDEAIGIDTIRRLKNKYKRGLYELNCSEGIAQYPDANSSMRLSYGNVKNLVLDKKTVKSCHTQAGEILEKYDSCDYNFTLKPELVKLYRSAEWGKYADANGSLWVNFITTNDITGGNSGSPVIDAEGSLVGLAFDGNKEGLACDYYYDSVRNRCVCVDIRYILWIIDNYGHAENILKEIL